MLSSVRLTPLNCSHLPCLSSVFFFFNDTATTEIYTLSLHDALPISGEAARRVQRHPASSHARRIARAHFSQRSEEHTSELQSHLNLVCRLLLEKKKTLKRTVSSCMSLYLL